MLLILITLYLLSFITQIIHKHRFIAACCNIMRICYNPLNSGRCSQWELCKMPIWWHPLEPHVVARRTWPPGPSGAATSPAWSRSPPVLSLVVWAPASASAIWAPFSWSVLVGASPSSWMPPLPRSSFSSLPNVQFAGRLALPPRQIGPPRPGLLEHLPVGLYLLHFMAVRLACPFSGRWVERAWVVFLSLLYLQCLDFFEWMSEWKKVHSSSRYCNLQTAPCSYLLWEIVRWAPSLKFCIHSFG